MITSKEFIAHFSKVYPLEHLNEHMEEKVICFWKVVEELSDGNDNPPSKDKLLADDFVCHEYWCKYDILPKPFKNDFELAECFANDIKRAMSVEPSAFQFYKMELRMRRLERMVRGVSRNFTRIG